MANNPPTDSTLLPPKLYLYEVEFRRGKEIVEKSVSCLADFSVGEFVKVEKGRGYEVGVVYEVKLETSESMTYFSIIK
jgi:hypothetical protein